MGYFRLALALMITAAHCQAISIEWAKGAVMIFYALSGYLAALSMMGNYQGRPWQFMAGRWFRVWPCYAVVFVAALAWLLRRGATPIGLALGIPSMPLLLAQLAMLPVPVDVGLIVPTAWMLPRLMGGWAMLALCPRWGGYAMLALGLLIAVAWPDYYGFPLAAASLGLGAVAYHGGVILPRDGRWAAMTGALSLPLFLVHPLVLGELAFWVPLGWPLFFASLPLTLAISWLLVVAVERPISRYRKSLLTKG